jgi:hypothetical protein
MASSVGTGAQPVEDSQCDQASVSLPAHAPQRAALGERRGCQQIHRSINSVLLPVNAAYAASWAVLCAGSLGVIHNGRTTRGSGAVSDRVSVPPADLARLASLPLLVTALLAAIGVGWHATLALARRRKCLPMILLFLSPFKFVAGCLLPLLLFTVDQSIKSIAESVRSRCSPHKVWINRYVDPEAIGIFMMCPR